MRKIIYLALLSACLSTTACGRVGDASSRESDGSPTRPLVEIQNAGCYLADDFYDFVDPDTGVHYIAFCHSSTYKGMGGITPRLNSDGTVMVTK